MNKLRKICTFVVAVCLLACSLMFCNPSHISASAAANADLTITSAADLIAFSQRVNAGENFTGKRVAQTADIDLNGVPFTPIGLYGKGNYFYGVYDGQGHTIAGLNISNACGTSNNGLFGHLGGTIINLGLINGNVSGSCCGSFASHAASSQAMIINCFSTLTLNCSRTGGIADNFIGSIINCLYYHSTQSYAVVGYHVASLYHSFAQKPLPQSFKGFTQEYQLLSGAPTEKTIDALSDYRTTIFTKISLPEGTKLYGWELKNGEVSFSNHTIDESSARIYVYLKKNLAVICFLAIAGLCFAFVCIGVLIEKKEGKERE
ncbi:MAG: hypothetical protein E7363_04550 [Clostridiales bacterium]|nr:hypothetical protein [Clostridiales bacterium]